MRESKTKHRQEKKKNKGKRKTRKEFYKIKPNEICKEKNVLKRSKRYGKEKQKC